ncbi:F0F1 ATP synthase subunit epsilon [Marinimicrobium locisalis]|uniref:F0F1 ATP synthase subunit epsilon n=1 Tax=Marinimicrobium locisalis TaxID=546022 RepID=UPI0032213B40
MAMTFHCDIVSAEREIFSGLIKMVVAPGTEGELGIIYGHAPLLTALEPGPVRVVMDNDNEDEQVYYVSGGYLEVQPYHVTILADTALRAGDMDEAAAEEAKEQALKQLTNQSGEIDYSRAAIELAEAAAQLRTLQSIRKRLGSNK